MAVSGRTAAPFEIPYLDETDTPDMGAGDKAIAERVAELLAEISPSQITSAFQQLLVPTGSLLATACAAPPTGFLLCEGQAISRTTYKTLFEAIGTAYGEGNKSSTFNVPDLRGRVPVGVDGAAGRLSANDELGKSGGEEKHTLTVPEMPAHAHELTGLHVANAYEVGTFNGFGNNVNPTPTSSVGGGTAHNNMQPYQVVNYLIKT